MDSILGSVGRVANVKVRSDDDLVDRINHLYTTGILIIFTVVVSARQYVGDPIRCWCPAEFPGTHVDYTNNICWIANTYFVLVDHPIPSVPERERRELNYYQWVPVMLLVQALLFYIPCIVWRLLNGQSGINVDRIVSLGSDAQYESPENRIRTIKYVVRHLDRCLDNQRESRSTCCVSLRHFLSAKLSILCGKRYGNFLVGVYFFVKLLYITNAIGQFFLLNEFLGQEFSLYGFQVLDDLINGREDGITSHRFPRTTLCDFQIRQFTNVHRYTVQCVLPINLFSEKIYIFLWFWFVFCAVLSCYSFASWIWYTVFPTARMQYVRKFLRVMDRIGTGPEKKLANRFTMEYLRHDGVFTLRLVGKNSSDIVVAEILAGLWDMYRTKKAAQIRNNTLGTEFEGEDV